MRPVPVFPDYLVKLVIPASRAILKPAVIYRCVSLQLILARIDFLNFRHTYVHQQVMPLRSCYRVMGEKDSACFGTLDNQGSWKGLIERNTCDSKDNF